MMLASGLTASFVVAGLSAWRLLKAPADPAAARTLRTGIVIAAVLAPLQIFAGDQHGLNTLEYQPEKIAAIEAHLARRARRSRSSCSRSRTRPTRHNDFAISIPQARA